MKYDGDNILVKRKLCNEDFELIYSLKTGHFIKYKIKNSKIFFEN